MRNIPQNVAIGIVAAEYTRLAEDMGELGKKCGEYALQYDGCIYHSPEYHNLYGKIHNDPNIIAQIKGRRAYSATPLDYIDEMDAIHERTMKICSDINSIRGMLTILWNRLLTSNQETNVIFQNMRDAVPEIIVPFLGYTMSTLPRKNEEMYTIKTNPMKLKQVEDLLPLVAVYTMGKFIY